MNRFDRWSRRRFGRFTPIFSIVFGITLLAVLLYLLAAIVKATGTAA